MNSNHYVAVIDCGSQTTKLIARRIRELGVFSRIFMPSVSKEELLKERPSAIILSGGPESLLASDSLRIDKNIFDVDIPILGICYGMQLIVDNFGGVLESKEHREFGQRVIAIDGLSPLFNGLKKESLVWMSHSDQCKDIPQRFRTIASSTSCAHVAIAHETRKIFACQFHPEVSHSQDGLAILSNFLFAIAKLEKSFDLGDFLAQKIEAIKKQTEGKKVIMALSGGVDSMVAALMIHKAIKDQLHCVYVNHGLYRNNEPKEVEKLFASVFEKELTVVNAEEQFFSALSGITDPEQKRKIIGKTFIEIFEQEAKKTQASFLGQGTLYPDVIESPNKTGGPSHGIKSHHNVGGLPQHMNLQLVEPLRELFKDEVRAIGKLMGLADEVVMREPFPGPGFAVRAPGAISRERIALLRSADRIVQEEMKTAISEGHYKSKVWQCFAILLPVKSVGVMGDARAYGETIVIRAVESEDAMTADWCKLPHELLLKMSTRITNEVRGINRVLYDITQKPPGTIEWE